MAQDGQDDMDYTIKIDPTMLPTSVKTLGALIRKLRKRAGLSQSALGDFLGYSDSNISRFERDEEIPSNKVLLDMKQHLNCSEREFGELCEAMTIAILGKYGIEID